jgi:glucose/arabinose dehydrogenase
MGTSYLTMTFRWLAAISAGFLVLIAVAGPVHAQGTGLRIRRIAIDTGTGGPLNLTVVASAPGDPGRLFVGRINGVIRVLNLSSGTFNETPFVALPDGWNGNGLLNVVFDPRWQQNGFFYASKQDTGGWIAVYRGRISASNPNVADPASIQMVFRRFVVTGQHTGGLLAFGNDGFLYLTSGDQANGGGPAAAQSLATWAGKVFRIDVDGPDNIPGNADDDGFPADNNNLYTIPAHNPYVGVANALPEIWARGLRNPYRASVDTHTGDFWIGDVGQTQREEVSIMPAGQPGMNFGWPVWEGSLCMSTAAGCSALGATPPLLDYPRPGGAFPVYGATVIGGSVYRGCAMPWLDGTYFFSDFFGGWIATMRVTSGQRVALTNRQAQISMGTISCFTQGGHGGLYFCNYNRREVFAIEPLAARDCNQNGTPDGCEGLPMCVGDFNGDCGVEIGDLLGFLAAFESGHINADYDDGSGEGLVDGAVTIDDLLTFLVRFEAGC